MRKKTNEEAALSLSSELHKAADVFLLTFTRQEVASRTFFFIVTKGQPLQSSLHRSPFTYDKAAIILWTIRFRIEGERSERFLLPLSKHGLTSWLWVCVVERSLTCYQMVEGHSVFCERLHWKGPQYWSISIKETCVCVYIYVSRWSVTGSQRSRTRSSLATVPLCGYRCIQRLNWLHLWVLTESWPVLQWSGARENSNF